MLLSENSCVKGAEHCEVGDGEGVLSPIPGLAVLCEFK